jgi:hypothetical protein
VPRAEGIWLTRRNSLPTLMRAAQCLCKLTIVFKNVRRRHREPSPPAVRLPYSRTVSSPARRSPFANVVAKSCEVRSKDVSSAPAFSLKCGRIAAGPRL